MKLKFLFAVIIIGFAKVSFAQEVSRPNIIFILADDLGYGDLGCYGQQKIETPNIDALVKSGVRFSQFYAGTTVCAPSRCSLMMGLHTGHTPVRGNQGTKPEGQFPLPANANTFVMELQKAGYATAAFGKWGLGYITTTGDPSKKGFDQFYGYNCQTLAHNYFPDHLWNNHDRIDLSGNLKYDSVYSADLIHAAAMQFLETKRSQPFFLFLPYTLPHADVFVPHDSLYNYYVKKFNEQPVQVPTVKDEEKSHYDPYPHAAFAAMVGRLDRYVGEILKLLKRNEMEENTLVIFSSDNGPHREKGGDPAFFNSNGSLNGIKRDLYEGGIRVPFIAYQKGVTQPETVNNTPVAMWDLFPTFLQLASVHQLKNIDGISILPAIKGESQKQHEYFYWEFHEGGGKQAVRLGQWKGIKLNVSKNVDTPMELYDLKSDPQEKNNIAATRPEVVKKIELIMKSAHVPDKNWPLLPNEAKN